MNLIKTAFYTFALGIALFSFSARADEITADLVEISTPVYRPILGEFEPKTGVYGYEVSWQGIPAAYAEIRVEQHGLQYNLSTKVKTNSVVDLLYTLRYSAEGDVSAIDYQPMRTTIDQTENSRHKVTNINFSPNGEIESVRRVNDDPEKVLKFNPKNFTLDPFSAAFLARSLKWDVGTSYSFDTFNGKSRYLITLTATDKTTLEVNDAARDVFVVSPTVKNLTNPKANGKLNSAEIYVTADKAREIVKIVSSVFVGKVTTKLVSFAPLNGPAMVVAVNK